MPLAPSPHARWLSRHLQTTVSACARRAGVDLWSFRKVCRGVPKVASAERLARIQDAHGLAPQQFGWNVSVGWHWKKSFGPRKRPGMAHEFARTNDLRSAGNDGVSQWCRPDLCRLVNRCAAAQVGDFTGRLLKACLHPQAHPPAMPRERSHRRLARAGTRRGKATQ